MSDVPWSPRLTAIAAVSDNGIIGDGRDIPWYLPQDFARFKAVTMGGWMVFGRKTHEAIGRPLFGRRTIVVTRDPSYTAPDVEVAHTIAEVLAIAATQPDMPIWIGGGGEVYRLFWDDLTDLDVTEVHLEAVGATTFPAIDPAVWEETSRDPHPAGETTPAFDFVTYRRRSGR